MTEDEQREEVLLIAEAQLLLAEKRTYYALLRTGLAIVGAAIAAVTFLVVTKDFHELFNTLWLATIILGSLAFLALLGFTVFFKAERKIKHLTHLIETIEQKNKRLAELLV